MTAVRRRLDAELVRRGLTPSAAEARAAIAEGRVTVAGAPAASAARLVTRGDALEVASGDPAYVSRGGEKLAPALDAFGLDPAGQRALDVGASTGGFTDCLLRRGAAAVVTVDVGTGQLAWTLRTDPRVTAYERTDVRAVDAAALGGPFSLVVVDVSFIGLATLVPTLARLVAPGGDLVALVKPQFEAPRDAVPPDGVVRDPAVRAAAVAAVRAAGAAAGLPVVAEATSTLAGAEGNVEVFLHAQREHGRREQGRREQGRREEAR